MTKSEMAGWFLLLGSAACGPGGEPAGAQDDPSSGIPLSGNAGLGSTTFPGMNDAYSTIQDGSVFCSAQAAYVSRVVVTFHTRPGICAWSEDVITRNDGVLCSRHPNAIEITVSVTRASTSPISVEPGTYRPIVSDWLYVVLVDAEYGGVPYCVPGFGGPDMGDQVVPAAGSAPPELLPLTLNSLTLDRIDDSVVTGSIEVTANSGETLSGTFTAPNCPIQEYAQGSTCGQYVGECISDELYCVP